MARIASEQRNEIETILKKPFLPLSTLTNDENLVHVIDRKIRVCFFSSFFFPLMNFFEILFFR